jgi:hypothetical protein
MLQRCRTSLASTACIRDFPTLPNPTTGLVVRVHCIDKLLVDPVISRGHSDSGNSVGFGRPNDVASTAAQ